MHIDEFDYHLPQELIAQHPSDKRDASRLMVLHRQTGEIEHRHFYNVMEYLNPGDCLVLNNSKVLPARLLGKKEITGAGVEFLLLRRKEGDVWETMVKPGKRLHPGDVVSFSEGRLRAKIVDYGEEGTRIVEFLYDGCEGSQREDGGTSFLALLEEIGEIPLPPYIERKSDGEDRCRYQTVYCKEEGSVAAPTAGLHFTEELLDQIKAKGVRVAYVTLHVGIGTFRPVKCSQIEEHKMHFEEFEINQENADIINEVKRCGGRIISVGTTSSRTLESAAVKANQSESSFLLEENDKDSDKEKDAEGKGTFVVLSQQGSTGIFIYPGYQFKIVDALITNFHLPKSTLLMLISALYNRKDILAAYEEAVKEEYRFFSYGDAMMIV